MVRNTGMYDVLGVSPTATDEELKRAHRKQAMKYHPDRPGGNEAKFKEVQKAYETLSDKRKREIYDQTGDEDTAVHGHETHPGGAGGFHGFPGGGGQTFVFTTSGPGGSRSGNIDPAELEKMFGGFGGLGGFGGFGGRTRRQSHRMEMDDDDDMMGGFGRGGGGGAFDMSSIFEMLSGMGGPGHAGGGRMPGGKLRRGARVEAHGLQSTPQLNGARGVVIGMQGNRVLVDFGEPHGEKALREDNLRPARVPHGRRQSTEFAPGDKVEAQNLRGAPELNGRRGVVQELLSCGRVTVDFGAPHGVKSLRVESLRPLRTQKG
eukprot:Hpha_TRINITY_DN15949_c0_g6::TRINITY_DN15949_c0_g6_i1::g.75197::m.75197